MKRKQARTWGPMIGIAAVGAAVLTIGVSAYLQSNVDSAPASLAPAGSGSAVSAPIEVAIVPSRIDVIGVRAQPSVLGQVREVRSGHRKDAT